MTPEEKVALLKEAGVWDVIGYPTCIDKLFDLVAKHERNRHAWTQEHWTQYEHAIAAAEREACAKVCEELDLDWRGLESRIDCAAAIRAIKFEGDTGFRPVSEMIAEHKQDTKKAAAIEKAKMRKATRAEKVAVPGVYEVPVEQAEQKQAELKECRHCGFLCKPNQNESKKFYPLEQAEQEPVAFKFIRYVDGKEMAEGVTIEREKTIAAAIKKAVALCPDRNKTVLVYAAPVRTKDLTDDEIANTLEKTLVVEDERFEFQGGRILTIRESELLPIARAVIAADRSKNGIV